MSGWVHGWVHGLGGRFLAGIGIELRFKTKVGGLVLICAYACYDHGNCHSSQSPWLSVRLRVTVRVSHRGAAEEGRECVKEIFKVRVLVQVLAVRAIAANGGVHGNERLWLVGWLVGWLLLLVLVCVCVCVCV